MTNDPLYHRLLEISWRRKLTDAEAAEVRAWLAAHPEAQGQWQLEAGLNDLLEQLPQAPVPSNFTARVLAQVQREIARDTHPQRPGWHWWNWGSSWLPRTAVAALVLGSGVFAYRQHQTFGHRKDLAQNLVQISELASMSPQIVTNFAAIQLMSDMGSTPNADVQLLSLLQ